jgi:hypothetical protein
MWVSMEACTEPPHTGSSLIPSDLQQNLDDALDMLRFIDTDHDRRVSQLEFLTVMEALTEPMTQEELDSHVATLLGARPDEAFNEPEYHHPTGV